MDRPRCWSVQEGRLTGSPSCEASPCLSVFVPFLYVVVIVRGSYTSSMTDLDADRMTYENDVFEEPCRDGQSFREAHGTAEHLCFLLVAQRRSSLKTHKDGWCHRCPDVSEAANKAFQVKGRRKENKRRRQTHFAG